eukprot:177624-Lingulodinium_polyedra.AAC.1
MRALAEDDPIGTRGIFLHPADLAPAPAEESFISAKLNARDRWGQELVEEVGIEEVPIITDGYPDGAFFPHPVKELGRAGWAVVCKDELDRTVAVLSGPVGKGLPQSSQAAEYVAATKPAPIMGAEHSMLFIDCMNVVKDFNRAPLDQTSAKRKYAGLLLEAQAFKGWSHALEARWQKSHLTVEQLE